MNRKGIEMPRINDMFPKKHLTPVDLGINSVNITIERVNQVEVFDQNLNQFKKVWALFFKGKNKYMILNPTNANMLKEIFGSDDSDDWTGKKIVIYVADIKVAGKKVKALRIKASPDPVEQSSDNGNGDPEPQETEEELRARVQERTSEEMEANKREAENPNGHF